MVDEPTGSDSSTEETTTPEEPTANPQNESVEKPSEPEGEAKPEGKPQATEEKPSDKDGEKPDDTPAQPQEYTVGTHKFDTVEELQDFAKKTYGQLGGAVGALKKVYPHIKDDNIENVLATGEVPTTKEASEKVVNKAVEKLVGLGYNEKDATALVAAQKILMEESGVVTKGSPELDPDLNSFKKKAIAFIKSNPEAANVADVMDNIFHINYAKGTILEPEEIYKRAQMVVGENAPTAPAKTEEQKTKEELQRNQATGMPSGGADTSDKESKGTIGESILKSAGLL